MFELYFAAFFWAAHRFRCAAAILSRASGLNLRFTFFFVMEALPEPPPPKMLRTCCSLAISSSMAAMID